MAARRGAWRTFLHCQLVLAILLLLPLSQAESGDYYVYHVEPSLHMAKRSTNDGRTPTATPAFVPTNSSKQVAITTNATNANSTAPYSAPNVPPTTNNSRVTSKSPDMNATSSSASRITGSPSIPLNASKSVPPGTPPLTYPTAGGDVWDNAPMYPSIPNNETFQDHNINKTGEDHHKYYNSTFIVDPNVGSAYWVNMSIQTGVIVNDMLSNSHRRAATVRLSFDFPFYGHMVRNVTIATGGFLYTGDFVHSWLAATQYIAPLMANFDTSLSNTSFVKYFDNGTAFTVQWEKVVLQDKPDQGDFSFQVTLHKNGDIVFVYQHVPVLIEDISDESHPVKVGLSDAYIVDRNIFFVRRKTIYEYHRVHFTKEDIKNWTVIYMYALPTCVELKDCKSCLAQSIGFECQWCISAGRCSDGMDRYRQDWMYQECHVQNYTHTDQCEPATVPSVLPTAQAASEMVPQEQPVVIVKQESSSGAGTIVIFFLAGFVVLTSVLWVTYAYRNPHTASGQILIKYRPSQWRWRRGEARYTAATIHM